MAAKVKNTAESSNDQHIGREWRAPPSGFPHPEMAVSYHSNGTVLSVFGSPTWDYTPSSSSSRHIILNFPYASADQGVPLAVAINMESRWLFYLVRQKKSDLKAESYQPYVGCLKDMAQFAQAHGVTIVTLLSDSDWMTAYLAGHPTRQALKMLPELIRVLLKLPWEQIGFDPIGADMIDKIRDRLSKLYKPDQQHPPVPFRILSVLIGGLLEWLSDFVEVEDEYLSLAALCSEDLLIGRSKSAHENAVRLGKVSAMPQVAVQSMASLLNEYGLTEYFAKYGLAPTISGLSTGLVHIQSVCKYVIHIFSGMRDMEVTDLPLDCTETYVVSGVEYCLIVGDTTKFAPNGRERTKWVTSKEGHQAIDCALHIADAIYEGLYGVGFREHADLVGARLYLFVSPVYFGMGVGIKPQGNLPRPSSFTGDTKHLSRVTPTIQEEDLRELEAIDSMRAWRQDGAFELGELWPLSTHQIRRSVALYAQRSGLVSLSSLRRQLKHLTDAMSLYYARGSAFATDFIGIDKDHFGREWRKSQPKSQALSYEFNVQKRADELFGGHVYWLKKTDNEGRILIDRAATEKRFEKGEMAYRETALGGCVSTDDCGHGSVQILNLDCLNGCPNLVGDVVKLRRFKKAQESFVAALDPLSTEYAAEVADLAVISKVLITVEKELS
ncbi:MAG TPA: hypothetical protein VFS95_02225 [Telluria sp.]|nr:hypothetical protein [Telluria sp.]